jgi:hypothetical protein
VAIVVGVIVIAGLVAILVSLGVLLKRLFGGASDAGSAPQRPTPPYGGLPGLGPVGSLGELSPDTDINDPNASPDDLLGH